MRFRVPMQSRGLRVREEGGKAVLARSYGAKEGHNEPPTGVGELRPEGGRGRSGSCERRRGCRKRNGATRGRSMRSGCATRARAYVSEHGCRLQHTFGPAHLSAVLPLGLNTTLYMISIRTFEFVCADLLNASPGPPAASPARGSAASRRGSAGGESCWREEGILHPRSSPKESHFAGPDIFHLRWPRGRLMDADACHALRVPRRPLLRAVLCRPST